MKIVWVAGARPNFMKIAPIWQAMQTWNRDRGHGQHTFEPLLVHTGQHYDANMSDVFFRDLALPAPHCSLGVGSGSHAEQTARVMIEFERLLLRERPAMVGVVGDVNSTAACALTTAKSYILPEGRTPLLLHVEAGLRSGDRLMPEEINRMVTDVLADMLFTSEESGTQNLLREGIPPERIHFVGNVMVDSLFSAVERVSRRNERNVAGSSPAYGLVTLHRPSNVDAGQALGTIIAALERTGRTIPVYFPMHPRTRARCADLNIPLHAVELDSLPGTPGLHVLPPLGYDDFLTLMMRATVVITDSGGIQEETTALGIPCITLRENTERPVTVTMGTNVLAGQDTNLMTEYVERILGGEWKKGQRPPLWDGHAAERIVDILSAMMERRP